MLGQKHRTLPQVYEYQKLIRIESRSDILK